MVAELTERLEAQNHELQALRDELELLPRGKPASPRVDQDRHLDEPANLGDVDRRTLLRRGGLVAGAVAAGSALAALPATPAAAAAGGTLVLLGTTTRIYDSRAGNPPIGVTKGPWTNTTRAVDTTLNASGVPKGTATGVMVNLAVTSTGSGGFGAAFPTGMAWPGNASVNWSMAAMTISNLAVVALDANAVFNLKISGTADVIIDLIGYYV